MVKLVLLMMGFKYSRFCWSFDGRIGVGIVAVSDVNKDWTHKDQDRDKDKNKGVTLVLKGFLTTRTRINITGSNKDFFVAVSSVICLN